jgi:hypothetical protein
VFVRIGFPPIGGHLDIQPVRLFAEDRPDCAEALANEID